ncbi:MAG: CBS domain-containing protein, partial [Peptococcaceae bacterium]|nr:CBS domain-containing protein [Peptococcaceae bacterium]
MIIGDLMTRDTPLLHPNDTLEHAVKLLRKTKMDGLSVVDGTGKLMGIFTKADMMDAYLSAADKSENLENYYTRKVVTVDVNTPLSEFERIVKRSPVGNGVVTDEQHNILGLFTKIDLIMALLKEAETLTARLNAVYNAMHNGLIVVDKRRVIEFINVSGEKMLGLKQKELRGCLFDSVFANIDLAPVLGGDNLMIGVKEQINGVEILYNISPIEREAEITGAIIIFQDMTDIEQIASELETTKRLSEILLTVLNIAYEAIVVIDDQARITFVNEAACEFFNKPEFNLMNQPVDQVVENTLLPRTIKTGMSEFNDIQVIGGRRYLVSRMPIVRNGKVVGAVGKIIFQRLEQEKAFAELILKMENELTYYREKTKQDKHTITFDQIVTNNKDMRKLKKEAERVARGISTIMLNGESGTGKELFAEAIHNA